MKIEIIKEGKKDAETGKELKVGDKLTVSDERGKKAIANGSAKEVETKKESTQEKVSKKTTKK